MSCRPTATSNLYEAVPIGEDIVVTGYLSGENRDSLQITDWHLATDDLIDWANDEGLPGVQVEKLKSIQDRSDWNQLELPGASSPDPDDIDEEEERMRELLFSKGEGFVSFDNTHTFVGRFERDGAVPIFRTMSGVEYRYMGVKRRSKGTPDRRRRGTPFSDNMMLVC